MIEWIVFSIVVLFLFCLLIAELKDLYHRIRIHYYGNKILKMIEEDRKKAKNIWRV
jgi:nucleoside recognition membrane protein YjiH